MDAVLGTCIGYEIRQIKPFVQSLKEQTSARAVLFTDKLSGRTTAWLRDNGVETILYRDNGLHMMQARFYNYHEFLSDAPYERVLLADVADVLFQAEIFTGNLAADGLHVFQEEPSVSIGQDKYNPEWIRGVYGEEGLKRVADNPIICAGTTLGDISSVRLYLDIMLKEFERHSGSGGEQALKIGMDQGVHNYLIYTGEMEKRLAEIGRSLHIHANGQGVSTVGLMDRMLVRKDNCLLNGEGQLVPVVHQYDRIPLLRQMFKQKYFRKEDRALYRFRHFFKGIFKRKML